MNFHDFLGVDTHADERTIKRAYAKLLKTTRPDDDPAAFQRLNEAYQHALHYAQRHAAVQAQVTEPAELMALAEGDEESDIASRSEPSPTPEREAMPARYDDQPVTRPRRVEAAPTVAAEPLVILSPQAVLDEVMDHARRLKPGVLLPWLNQHEALYSISLKHVVAVQVWQIIVHDDAALPLHSIRLLAEFFDLQLPEDVKQRLDARRAALENDTKHYGESRAPLIRILKSKFRWPLALLQASVPTLAARLALLSAALNRSYGNAVPELNPRQTAFFDDIANPLYVGRWRWAVILLGSVVATLLVGGIAIWTKVSPDLIGTFTGYAFLSTLMLQVGWHELRWLVARQHQDAREAPWYVSLLPVGLAVAALAVATAWPSGYMLALFLVGPAALMYFVRIFDALRFCVGAELMCAAIDSSLPRPPPGIAGLAGVVVGMTVCNLVVARRDKLSMAAAMGNQTTYVLSYMALAVCFLATLLLSIGQ